MWATEMTTMTGRLGAVNNTDVLMANHSKHVSLAANESYVYSIVNHQAGSGDFYKNWAIEFRGNNPATEYATFRADGAGWKGDGFSAITNDDGAYLRVTDWMSKYNGANVTITVSRSADGSTITIVHTSDVKDDSNNDYGSTFTITVAADETITFYLGYEAAWLDITNVHANTTTAEKNYALLNVDHTASSSRNGSNAITTTVDAENEHYNNSKAAAWGGWAYAQFSYTIPVGYSVESATLTWSTTIIGNSGTRNNDIYYVNAGTTIDYASLTSSTNLNPDATFIVQVQKTGPATHTGIETDVSSAVRTIASTQNYIIFKWTNNAAGADLHGKSSANAPTLELVTTAETFYTATFNANGGALSPSVTVYSDAGRTSPIAKDALSANTTYYYTATLAGYSNYEGSFEVETSNPVVNFTMTSLPRYTFTVNAVNSVGSSVIEAIYTDDDSYDGKIHNVYFPKYLTGTGNIVTFSKDDATYYQQYTSASADATKSASYTAYDGVAYFFEGESYASLGTKETNANYSNGSAGRGLNNNTLNVATIPVAGNYDITYAVCSNNVGTGKETQFSFYRNNSGNVVIDVTNLNHSVNDVKTTGTQTENNITFAAGDVLQFYAKETKVILDYVLVKLASVPATLDAGGYATFASPYALNVASMTANSGDVTAYKAAVDGTVAKFTALSQSIPANTGILLKGDANATVTIPVVASGTAVDGNVFQVNPTGAALATDNANHYFAMKKGEATLTFAPFEPNGFEFPASKAYLKVSKSNFGSGARELSVSFDDDVTGVNEVRSQKTAENSEFFDLQGRKVAQPTKGLYIVNGKKVVIK